MSETENPAEALREAAALMRSRAEVCNGDDMEWWTVDGFAEVTNYDDAEHFVAFGHPAVALHVAELLSAEAEYDDECCHNAPSERRRHALNVARIYLGKPA